MFLPGLNFCLRLLLGTIHVLCLVSAMKNGPLGGGHPILSWQSYDIRRIISIVKHKGAQLMGERTGMYLMEKSVRTLFRVYGFHIDILDIKVWRMSLCLFRVSANHYNQNVRAHELSHAKRHHAVSSLSHWTHSRCQHRRSKPLGHLVAISYIKV